LHDVLDLDPRCMRTSTNDPSEADRQCRQELLICASIALERLLHQIRPVVLALRLIHNPFTGLLVRKQFVTSQSVRPGNRPVHCGSDHLNHPGVARDNPSADTDGVVQGSGL
jgi:hypothetical protein